MFFKPIGSHLTVLMQYAFQMTAQKDKQQVDLVQQLMSF